jgi:hypothetical protein
MRNKSKRVPYYDLDQVIEELEKHDNPDRHMERILLTIMYAIQDIKDEIGSMDDQIRGYDP